MLRHCAVSITFIAQVYTAGSIKWILLLNVLAVESSLYIQSYKCATQEAMPCKSGRWAHKNLAVKFDMKRFASEPHLASFFGLLPSAASSDETIIEKGINPRCNKYLRSMIIEAAWAAIRQSPSLLAYYKKHSHMDSNKAIIKVARKLVMIIRAVWLTETPYQEGYQSEKKGKEKPLLLNA